MEALIAIPTWILTRILVPFLPITHPWHGRRFTLKDWVTHQTSLCQTLDFAFWIWLLGMAVFLIRIMDN